MEQPEKNDPTWELLSHASKVEPGPLFARNVVREVRNLGTPSKGLNGVIQSVFGSFRSPVFASGLAVAILAVAFVIWQNPTESGLPIASPSIVLEDQSEFDPATELEAVEYLGQLMAVADPGQLTDEALADLFF